MELGVNLAGDGAAEVAGEAERLGFTVATAPEGFRSDAATVLAWIAARTERIDLASGVFQMPARTPAMTALTAASLDALSQGRFRLGLGVSNPHVAEGWHGTPFARPLRWTREYVDVTRMALRREPVVYDGERIRLPLPGGRGGPMTIPGRPVRETVPVYLAAVGPRNLELAGEIADGWFGVFASPGTVAGARDHLAAGRARSGGDLRGFDVMVSVPMVVHDDPRAAAEAVRHYSARFLSLGHRHDNFYYRLLERLGHGAAAAEVQDRQRAGDAAGAAEAVPFEFVDSTALLGPVERIAERMTAYAEAGVTTLSISPFVPTVAGRIETLRLARRALGG